MLIKNSAANYSRGFIRLATFFSSSALPRLTATGRPLTVSNVDDKRRWRQYMPKGTDLSRHSREDLMRIQRSLNGRSRETPGYMMPVEKHAELVALTG